MEKEEDGFKRENREKRSFSEIYGSIEFERFMEITFDLNLK